MNTYILKEKDIDSYFNFVIKDSSGIEESKIKIGIMGLEEYELEEAKKVSKIGDCLLLEYDGKLLPFQVIHKKPGNTVILSSYYVLDNHMFDEKSNVWRDSSIRRYMNNDMSKKFDPEVLKLVKTSKVHTENYVTEDKFWLLSHEEIGYKDKNNMFKKNIGAEVFDYYKNQCNQTDTKEG